MTETIWDVNAVPVRTRSAQVQKKKLSKNECIESEDLAALEPGEIRQYTIEGFPHINLPPLHEIWNYEGDPIPLPGKWAKLANAAYPDKFKNVGAKEYFMKTWLDHPEWDPQNFFFITHRSEPVGTVMAWPDLVQENVGWIRMLAASDSPKYQDGQLVESLISLAVERLAKLGKAVVNVRVPAEKLFKKFATCRLDDRCQGDNTPSTRASDELSLPHTLLDPDECCVWSADITKYQSYTRNNWRDLCDPPLYHESWTHVEQDCKLLHETFGDTVMKSWPPEKLPVGVNREYFRTHWIENSLYQADNGFFITFEEQIVGTVIVFEDPDDANVGWVRAWCVTPKARG